MKQTLDKPSSVPRRFVLLDRDGTLNFDRNYLADPARLELIPGAGEALVRLRRLGLGLVVVTNQSGIARGLISPRQLADVHRRLAALLAEHDVRLDGLYCCPHGTDDDCTCRKPRPGLVEQAAHELGFDPRQGFVVGDKAIDIELGRRVGAVSLLVRTGYGAETEQAGTAQPDDVVDDLAAAAEVIERLVRASA